MTAGIQSMRKLRSRKMISASEKQHQTFVCFLHIQLLYTNEWLPQNAQNSSWFWFLSFKISCKIKVLKQSQSALPNYNIADIHLCDECTRSNAPKVYHKIFVHFETARAKSLSQDFCPFWDRTSKLTGVSQYELNTDISQQIVSKL